MKIQVNILVVNQEATYQVEYVLLAQIMLFNVLVLQNTHNVQIIIL